MSILSTSEVNFLSSDTCEELQQEVKSKAMIFDRKYFQNPWTASQWKDLDWQKYQLYFALDASGNFLGFLLQLIVPGESLAHILKLLVGPNYRYMGVASSLIRYVFDHAGSKLVKSYYLEVESTNEVAINFYKKHGFKVIHRKKSYYSNGRDALIMTHCA